MCVLGREHANSQMGTLGVYVCVREIERERGGGGGADRDRARQRMRAKRRSEREIIIYRHIETAVRR